MTKLSRLSLLSLLLAGCTARSPSEGTSPQSVPPTTSSPAAGETLCASFSFDRADPATRGQDPIGKGNITWSRRGARVTLDVNAPSWDPGHVVVSFYAAYPTRDRWEFEEKLNVPPGQNNAFETSLFSVPAVVMRQSIGGEELTHILVEGSKKEIIYFPDPFLPGFNGEPPYRKCAAGSEAPSTVNL